jgi:hypothetical protein
LHLPNIGSAATHQRVESGWCLIATETVDGPYTACAYLRTGSRSWPGENRASAGVVTRARVLDGRILLRADSETASGALAGLTAADPEREGTGGHVLDSHVLELVRLRDRARPPGFPVLVLAGPAPPEELMADLVPVVAAVRPGGASSAVTPRPASLRPRWGWWRHIAEASGDDVVIGIPFPALSPAEQPAMHMLLGGLLARIEARASGVQARELLTHEGTVFRVAWPGAGAAEAGSLRAMCREVMADFVEAPPDSMEYRRLLGRATQAIRGQRESPDRWFAREVMGASMGVTRATDHATLAALGSIRPDAMGPFAAAHLPPDVVVVSRGDGAYVATMPEPTERWSGGRPDSTEAAAWVLGRTRRALWGDDDPSGVCVTGVFELDAGGIHASGRLEESVAAGAVHRRFTPLGTGFAVESWERAGAIGGQVLGRERQPTAEEASRLRARHATDPWNLARTPLSKVHVWAGSFVAGRVYQHVEVVGDGSSMTLHIDPETGLPARVIVPPRGGDLASTSFRFSGYETRSGLTYPTRIEQFRGEVQQSVIRVGRWERCARLAGVETLQ